MTRHIARKRFGQHFLSDPSVVDAIVAEIAPAPGEAIVEIGPGLGALTDPLVARCGRLTVIELDRDLAARLRRRAQLDVVEAPTWPLKPFSADCRPLILAAAGLAPLTCSAS